ncbi:MAG: NUDIX hydrolase [Oscillospiraceae bacterium]|nr:NUDIX hydrolase [Oscillospiraceae bacterium]
MSYTHTKLSVAVDVLIFTIEDDKLKIVLSKRDKDPFKDEYALPGVSVREDETPEEAAQRSIQERTGLSGIFIEQLYTFGDIDRDPRSRTISIAYFALTDRQSLDLEEAGSIAALYDVDEVLSGKLPLAFDHARMTELGAARLGGKVMYSDIAFEFVPDEFTLPQLQRVYEILLRKPLYKANFRKMIAPRVEDTGKMLTGAAHRPSKLYRKAAKERSADTE